MHAHRLLRNIFSAGTMEDVQVQIHEVDLHLADPSPAADSQSKSQCPEDRPGRQRSALPLFPQAKTRGRSV